MSASVPFTYQYAFASDMFAPASGSSASGPSLDLATFDPRLEHPHFFRGRVREPRSFALNLLTLSKIVRTHFHLHLDPNYLDPVVTSAPDILRLEGFSACCGVYARADMPERSFDGEILRCGTTNVDFGTPMQIALARIGATDDIRFQVGRDEVELRTADEAVVERKVKLPARWVKSFAEVQTLQRRLVLRAKVNHDEAAKFFKTLPKGKPPKRAMNVVPSGRGIRLSTRPSRQGVAFGGVHRVAVLQPLIDACDSLRIWADDETGVSGWEISGASGRFFSMLSPQPYRGFSGEGANLSTLATEPWSFSQAGFDVSTQSEFARELPLDLRGLQKMQPRLKSAMKLVEQDGITLVKRVDATGFDLQVPGTSVAHYVRLRDDGDVCSCRWHSQYQGERGPCKHILASRLWAESKQSPSDRA